MDPVHAEYVCALGEVIAELRELRRQGIDPKVGVTTATLNLRDDLQYDGPLVPWHVERMRLLKGAIHDHYVHPLEPAS